jgi:hypothetical protein
MIPTPLPEVIVAVVCFALFIFFLAKGLCEAARNGDEVDQEIVEAARECHRRHTRELDAAHLNRVRHLPTRRTVRR